MYVKQMTYSTYRIHWRRFSDPEQTENSNFFSLFVNFMFMCYMYYEIFKFCTQLLYMQPVISYPQRECGQGFQFVRHALLTFPANLAYIPYPGSDQVF